MGHYASREGGEMSSLLVVHRRTMEMERCAMLALMSCRECAMLYVLFEDLKKCPCPWCRLTAHLEERGKGLGANVSIFLMKDFWIGHRKPSWRQNKHPKNKHQAFREECLFSGAGEEIPGPINNKERADGPRNTLQRAFTEIWWYKTQSEMQGIKHIKEQTKQKGWKSDISCEGTISRYWEQESPLVVSG